MRSKFDRELAELNKSLILLGGHIEQAIESSISALIKYNVELAATVIEGDKEIAHLSRAIESEAMKIILRQQPVAADLRMISTVMKITTDMERIGAQAREICGIVIKLAEEKYKAKFIILPKMADRSKEMVKLCIDSFVKSDIEIANKVIALDDDLDNLYKEIKEETTAIIKRDISYLEQGLYYMMVAKHFEKIGDYAENIAEWVIYSKTGERKKI